MLNGLSEVEQEALAVYIRRCADIMDLKDWRIELSGEPCPDNCFAVCSRSYVLREATIKVKVGWQKEKELDRRETICHELLHCHDVGLAGCLDKTLPDLLGSLAWSALRPSIWNHLELFVDCISKIIARQLPECP